MAAESFDFARPNRNAEDELILACARTKLQPDTVRRVERALKEKINWERLLQKALQHGTATLLFWNLRRLNGAGIPSSVLAQLEDSYRAIARWNLRLCGELLELLNLFREREIRALPLKGPALAAAAYGNLSLRIFSDLDIYMPREDILKGKDILQQRGYQPKLHLTPDQEAEYLHTHHDYKFIRAADGTVVELQWGITQWSFAFPLDFDEIWKDRRSGSLAGASIFNLPPDTLLLVLCVHGTKHRWGKLMWICDIAELIDADRENIDWHRLLARARANGGERMLLLGLYLAQDLLGAVLPDNVVARINRDRRTKSIAAQIEEELSRGFKGGRLQDEHPIFYWKTRERLRDKWGLLWKYFPEYFFRSIVPNQNDHDVVRLPSFLSLGYYLIRPVRLALRYWSTFRDRLTKVER